MDDKVEKADDQEQLAWQRMFRQLDGDMMEPQALVGEKRTPTTQLATPEKKTRALPSSESSTQASASGSGSGTGGGNPMPKPAAVSAPVVRVAECAKGYGVSSQSSIEQATQKSQNHQCPALPCPELA